MSKQNIDLTIFQNTNKIFEIDMSEDITDWAFYFTAKENMEDTDENAKISKDITSHSDPTAGKTLIEILKTDTATVNNLYYDVKYKDDNGVIDILFYGKLNIPKATTTRD